MPLLVMLLLVMLLLIMLLLVMLLLFCPVHLQEPQAGPGCTRHEGRTFCCSALA
jgi:hypothetical protein